jgi:hypothetical protein
MNILKCSSCGEDHNNINFKELKGKVEIDKIVYNKYFLCPKTGKLVYAVNLNNIKI